MTKPNEVTLEAAAKLVKAHKRFQFAGTEDDQKRQCEEAEATAVLETMLAAGRRGKTVRGE